MALDGGSGNWIRRPGLFPLGEKQELRLGFCLFTYLLKTEKRTSPVVQGKTLSSQCRGPGLDPWSEN